MDISKKSGVKFHGTCHFGLSLGARILKHADALSTTLQMKDLSACEAQEIADMTVKTLDSIRNDDSFHLFWQRVGAKE